MDIKRGLTFSIIFSIWIKNLVINLGNTFWSHSSAYLLAQEKSKHLNINRSLTFSISYLQFHFSTWTSMVGVKTLKQTNIWISLEIWLQLGYVLSTFMFCKYRVQKATVPTKRNYIFKTFENCACKTMNFSLAINCCKCVIRPFGCWPFTST